MQPRSRKPDSRPARTKATLFDALIELIQEKRWDKIRVQDLLDRTGIGRSTFYAHFDNKFDLLTGAMPDALVIVDPDGQLDMLSLFEHVEEAHPILRPIMSQPLLGEINAAFHRQLVTCWHEHLTSIEVPASRIAFVSDFLAGAFMSTIERWIATGCERPAVDVSAEHQTYVDAVLATSGRSMA